MFFNDNCDVWWPIWISRPPTAQRTALQDKALHAKAFETCWAQLSPVLCWTLSGLGFLWDPQSSPCWFTKSWASNNDNDIFFFGQLVNSHIIIWSIIIYNLLTNGHVHKKGPFVNYRHGFPQDDKSQGLTSTETAFSASASSLPVSCRDGPGERQMFRCFSMVSTEVFHGKNWKNMGKFMGKFIMPSTNSEGENHWTRIRPRWMGMCWSWWCSPFWTWLLDGFSSPIHRS